MSAFVPDQGVEMPALALRGINIFPHMLVHFDVVREASIKAVNEAMGSSQPIFLVAQKDLSLEAPGEDDLWAIGTIAAVKQILRLPDNNVRVMVEGSSRGKMLRLCAKEPYLLAQVETISAAEGQGRRTSPKMEAYVRQAYSLLEKYMQLSDRVTSETYLKAISSDDPGYLADYIAQNIPMRHEDKQAILEELIPGRRLEKLVRILTREVDILEVEGDLEAAVNEGVRRGYGDGYLRKSVVGDPLRRVNTGDNTPAFLTLHLVPGEGCRITVAPKGAGSENMSRLAMLKPADGEQGVKDFILDTVKWAGSNPCPPIVVGVGIGGSFDKCAALAKKALLRPLDVPNPDPYYAQLEQELLEKINELGIGPQGFGGHTTALGLAIETMPTHVACLPVAVNMSCHVTRRASAEL